MSADPTDPALALVLPLIESPECCCEYVDIGIGWQKVAESPDCPKCTAYGLAGAILGALFKAGLLAESAS